MVKKLLFCEVPQVLTHNKLCDQHVATLRSRDATPFLPPFFASMRSGVPRALAQPCRVTFSSRDA